MKILLALSDWLPATRLVRAVNTRGEAGLLTGACNSALDGKNDWSVIKYGVYPNKVGLQVFDRESAEAITRAFNSTSTRIASGFRGLPIYIGHPDDADWAQKNPGVRAEAVGRIRELKVQDDGLHLRNAYNDAGEKLLAGDAPAYDAFSSNWGMKQFTYQGRKAFRPMELYSIGLTNNPNIPGCYIGLNERLPSENDSPAMKQYIIALLAALGRPVANPDAVTDAQLETAVNESVNHAKQLVTDSGRLTAATNEKSTIQTQLTSAQSAVQTATNEAATLRTQLAAERSERATLVITRAINEGRITEANRAEWLGKFTAQGADFGKIEGELTKLTKAVNTKSRTEEIGRRRQAPGDQSKVRAINEAVANYKKENPGATHDAAFAAVREAKPDLFTNDKS